MPRSHGLMVLRRKLALAWLAAVLTAMAPVFAYAHMQLGVGGEGHQHCATDDTGDNGSPQHHSNPKKSAVPHCVYCPGFSAGVALAQSILGLPPQCVGSTPLARAPLAVPSGRSSIRISQQRAPPSYS